MDALTPPPPRRLPEERSNAMRTMLVNQAGSRRSWLRWLAPWLTAVAVPAIAATGALIIPGGQTPTGAGPGGRPSPSVTASPSPSGSPDSSPSPSDSWSPSPSESPTPSLTPTPSTSASGRPGLKAAYAACLQLVRGRAEFDGTRPPRGVVGRVAKYTTEGWTVVVANSAQAWACQVQPDNAITAPKSLPAPRLAQVTVDDVAVASNVRANREPNIHNGDMIWAGGPVPRGVDSIRYTFPDGHVEAAVISGGFWVMHYFSPASFDWTGPQRISVRLAGSAGTRSFKLTWGDDTCNQVSHGC